MILKRRTLIVSFFLLAWNLCIFGQEESSKSSAEILENYKNSLSWISFAAMEMKTNHTITLNGLPIDSSPAYFESELTFRRDRKRTEWLEDVSYYENQNKEKLIDSFLSVDILAGPYSIRYDHYINEPPLAASLEQDYKQLQEDLLNDPQRAGPLFGRMYGSNGKTIYDLLKESENLTLRDKKEMIKGATCHVLEGKSRYGHVTAWISPEKGYNALKWTIHKITGDFFNEDSWSAKLWSAELNSVELKRVGEYFVPEKGVFTHTITENNGNNKVTRYEYEITDIQLKPDYETLGAFEINLPEGTRAIHLDVPKIKFTWTNGKFVPDINDYTYKELSGKSLPDLNIFLKDLKPDYAKGKMILVCFWDIQQRPSRNFIIELVKQEQNFRDKNIEVCLVHTSKVESEELQQWVDENKILFTSGRVTTEYEKTLLQWGVRAHPWLILTDKNHMVTNEGISLNELNEIFH